MGALAEIEMALSVVGAPHAPDGVAAARDCLTETSVREGVELILAERYELSTR